MLAIFDFKQGSASLVFLLFIHTVSVDWCWRVEKDDSKIMIVQWSFSDRYHLALFKRNWICRIRWAVRRTQKERRVLALTHRSDAVGVLDWPSSSWPWLSSETGSSSLLSVCRLYGVSSRWLFLLPDARHPAFNTRKVMQPARCTCVMMVNVTEWKKTVVSSCDSWSKWILRIRPNR